MVGNAQDRWTYKPGDRIRTAIRVSDVSGVAEVRAAFEKATDSSLQVHLSGDGHGVAETEVLLEGEVPEGAAPGTYSCFQVNMTDSVGNTSQVSRPGIEFVITEMPGDRDGPELQAWRTVDLTEEETRLLKALCEQRFSQIRMMGETLAASVGVLHYEAVSRQLVEDGYLDSYVDEDGDSWLQITTKGVRKVQEQ